MLNVTDRRHTLTNTRAISGKPLNNVGFPSKIWMYWRAIAGDALQFPNYYAYITQESHTYTRRRIGLETKHIVALPDDIGVRIGLPNYSVRDQVDFIDKEKFAAYKYGPVRDVVVSPVAVITKMFVEHEDPDIIAYYELLRSGHVYKLEPEKYVMELYDRTMVLPFEFEIGWVHWSGFPLPKPLFLQLSNPDLSADSVLAHNIIEDSYFLTRRRGGAYSAPIAMHVISDGTVEDLDYDFVEDTYYEGPTDSIGHFGQPWGLYP